MKVARLMALIGVVALAVPGMALADPGAGHGRGRADAPGQLGTHGSHGSPENAGSTMPSPPPTSPFTRLSVAPCWCTRTIVESIEATQSSSLRGSDGLDLLQHPRPHTRLRPPGKVLVHRVPVSKPGRHLAPRRAGPVPPEYLLEPRRGRQVITRRRSRMSVRPRHSW
jgi:hypothetical protein